MKQDFYCLDADNRMIIFTDEKSGRRYLLPYCPGTSYHPAELSEKDLGDGRYELSVSILHGCDGIREVARSSIIVDSHCDELQMQQLANAWTLSSHMTGYYRKRLFHRLFFALVLRDHTARDIFQRWISKTDKCEWIIKPDLVAPGPVSMESK